MRLLPKSIHRCRRYPTKFNSGRDIPQVDSITGLLIDDIEKLKSGEEQSLRESYPALALADVRILEENRKPKSAAATMGMMLAGAALLLGGVVTLGRGLLD